MIKTHKCKNGFQITHVYSDCKLFRIELVIKAGMLQEKRNQLGFAHFIEHLMSFFPSNKFPNSKLNQQMLNTYALETNAYTSENACGYYVEGLTEYFYNIIDLIMQNYCEPVLDDSIFEQERSAVLNELQIILKDSAHDLEYLLQKVMYNGTILQETVSAEIINIEQNASLENILDFRHSFYRPEITTMIITSNFSNGEFKKLCNDIERFYFKSSNIIQKGNISKSAVTKLPKNDYSNYKFFYVKPRMESPSYNILFYFPVPIDSYSDDILILKFIEMILSDGMGARLYYALRTKLGAIYHIKTNVCIDPRNNQYNAFTIEVETSEERHVANIVDYVLIELFELIEENNITENEMIQKRNSSKMKELTEECTRSFLKDTLLNQERILWNKPIRSYAHIVRVQEKINSEDIFRIMKLIFNSDRMKIFYSGMNPTLLNDLTRSIHYTDNNQERR